MVNCSERNSEVLKEGTGWEDLGGAHQRWAQNWTNLQLYRERVVECVATKGPLGIRSLPTQKLLQISASDSSRVAYPTTGAGKGNSVLDQSFPGL